MSKPQVFRDFLRERLTTVALKIFGAVEKHFADYEEEIFRTIEQSARLQRIAQPDIKLHQTDVQQFSLLEPPQIKEEDELWTNQKEEQLQWLQSEATDSIFTKESEFSTIKMSKLQEFEEFQKDILTKAASEIFRAVEIMFGDYESKGCRTREENVQLQQSLDIVTQPEIKLHRADLQQFSLQDPPQIKEEQELWTNQGKGQLKGTHSQPTGSICASPSVKQHCDQDSYELPHLDQTVKVESIEGDSLTINSTEDQMKAEPDEKEFGAPEAASDSTPLSVVTPDCPTAQSSEEETGARLPILQQTSELKSSNDAGPKNNNRFSFVAAYKLNGHKCHTGEKTQQCHECNKDFSQTSHLVDHMRIHTGEMPNQCQKSKINFCQKNGIDKHMRLYTGKKPYKCQDSNKSFGQMDSLVKHMRTDTIEKPHKCQECNNTFSDKTNLVQHTKTHSGEKPHQCQEYNNSFRSTGNTAFVRHMRLHTREKPYQCQECNKSYTHVGNLVRHMRLHTGEKPHQCQECKKSLSRQYSLTIHKRLHTGENLYQCQECNNTFSDETNLVQHTKTHTGEKPHQCQKYKNYFRHETTFVRHMRLHTREKPHQCQECNKSYTLVGNLVRHMRIHTGEKPHP